MNLFDFIPGYENLIYVTGREPTFVMLIAFILTYIITRGYTRIARITGWGSASFGGVHTHHMVFGLVISFAAGALMFSLLPSEGWLLLFLAAAFGAGASLVLDEFALIFHLQDVYWEQEGRKSVDAVVLGILFGVLFLLHTPPLGTGADNTAGVGLVIILIVNLLFVFISGLKGKIFFAIFGVFIPLLALIAAIRLAEPDSVWSKKFYGKDGKKYKKSVKRYAHYESYWRTKKEYLWDVIGGKTGRPPITK